MSIQFQLQKVGGCLTPAVNDPWLFIPSYNFSFSFGSLGRQLAEGNTIGSANSLLLNTRSSSATHLVGLSHIRQYLAISHTVGWMSTLGWLASVASSVFVVTTQVQAMIDVTNSSFSFPNWQYTLIMLAFLVVTIFFNTWGAKILPMLEIASLVGHLGGFFVVMIPLLVLCQKNSANAVFLQVVNNGGWSSTGTACLVSQVTVMFCNLGRSTVALL